MAKHIHIHVGKAKDAVYNLRETNGTSWGNYSASSGAEAKELLKRDIKKDPSKFMGVKFLTNGDPDLSQVRSILHSQDAERFGLKEVTRAEFDKKTRNGEWEAMQDITSSGRVEVRNTSTNKRFQVYVKEAAQDATNHLGEKEYYTFRRWKEAVKAAYPNARFEGDQDMCNAVPGGEWDGEKGCVYAKKTGDANYSDEVRRQLQAINQDLTEAARKMERLIAAGSGSDAGLNALDKLINDARRKCFELR